MNRLFPILYLAVIVLLLTLYLISNVELKMKNVFIVEMSDSNKPVFPETCVVCRQAQSEPLGTLRISDENGRLDFYFYHLIKESPNENFLNVPAHDTCIKAVRNHFLKRFFLIMILPVSIGLIGMVYHLSLFYSAIAALLVIGPFLYWQLSVPVPMEYEHYSGKFVLVFKNRNYAADVAHLNHANMKEVSYPDRQPVAQ